MPQYLVFLLYLCLYISVDCHQEDRLLRKAFKPFDEAIRYGKASTDRNVLLIVPGIAGSGLLGTIKEANLPRCSSKPVTYSTPFRLWAALGLLRPPVSHQLCWIDMLEMEATSDGSHYKSKDGVNVLMDKPGTSHAFDYLDYYFFEKYGVPGTGYFHYTLAELYTSVGYEDGKTLRGFPYDWRLPPWQLDYEAFKTEIETDYADHGNKKVDILVHSLGGVIVNYFLNKVVTPQWKEKYINSYTLVTAAIGGSFKAIKGILSGYNDPVDINILNVIDFSLMPASVLKILLKSLGSMYSLIPETSIYGEDHVVIRLIKNSKEEEYLPENMELRRLSESEYTPKKPLGIMDIKRYSERQKTALDDLKSKLEYMDTTEEVYTLGNWTQLLEPELQNRVAYAKSAMANVMDDPGVPTYCIWSNFSINSTDISYVYHGDVDSKPIAILGPGDDTVPIESQKVCTSWKSIVDTKELENLDHLSIFNAPELTEYLKGIYKEK